MKIALCGLGRAGKQVLRYIRERTVHTANMAFCRNGGKQAGKSLSDVMSLRGFSATVYELKQAEEMFLKDKPDALIDFSNTKATMCLLPACARHGVNMVVCTTNFSHDELQLIRETADNTPDFALVYAPNITLGVNVLMMLCEELAAYLPGFDYAITEKHHNRKKDVSATAQKISKSLTGILEKPVPVNSIRAGGYVGLHEVLAVGEFERLTLIHESFSRLSFANGAIVAAEHLMGKEGYFEMRDVVREHFRAVRDGI